MASIRIRRMAVSSVPAPSKSVTSPKVSAICWYVLPSVGAPIASPISPPSRQPRIRDRNDGEALVCVSVMWQSFAYVRCLSSALQGARVDALDKLPLEQQIHQDHGDEADDGGGEDQAVVGRILAREMD